MSDHYFAANPSSSHEKREIQASFFGRSYSFITDAGVFSKKEVDFGSRLLIETVGQTDAERILDLGCGYGPIAIVMAVLHPAAQVVGVDVNGRAIELAKRNAIRNQVENRIQFLESDGFAKLDGQSFDLILCNPPIRAGKQVVYRLFRDAYEHLRPNGSLWIVIRKQQGAPSAKKELENYFAKVELVLREKGYWILQATNC